MDKAIAAGELEVLLDDFRPGSSPIYAVYPHRTYVAAKVRAFVGVSERGNCRRIWCSGLGLKRQTTHADDPLPGAGDH